MKGITDTVKFAACIHKQESRTAYGTAVRVLIIHLNEIHLTLTLKVLNPNPKCLTLTLKVLDLNPNPTSA